MVFPVFARRGIPRISLDLIHPVSQIRARARDASLVIGFSLVIGLSAQAAIPLPFTPVPVTLQTLAVLLAGALLGSGRGTIAVLLYLGEGLSGLPVFAGGGAGVSHLVGPTGGFLFGFIPAAYVVGRTVEQGWTRSAISILAVLVLGNACIYIPGLAWLGAFVGFSRVLSLGLMPFLAGDLLKIAAGSGLISAASLATAKAAARR
jgi:biotin transport system substrate-specific component